MTYESLLLNLGGGVIPSRHRSRQNTDAATLVIGIGGTGVAALAKLKQKVYQDLIPDNPGEPIPRYGHIQFLAIDSDEYDISKMKGKARINAVSEFFSIEKPHLKATLGGKDVIKNNPLLNWMEIDKINHLFMPNGAGGIRQVGRYLLMSKAAALKIRIEEKCTAALCGLGSLSLDIYIFAGISGGTGSGCFLDTCYIVRKVLEDKGWTASGNIMGFFFLPDVVVSRPEVAAIPTVVNQNYANGYAALKELDYHMDLRAACDAFRQNYGAFSVDTQKPPVDFCHLISATRADGTALPNGFSHAIHTAADYIMSYLIGRPNAGLTRRAHLAGGTHGIANLSHWHGANYSYHVLGVASAEVPTKQIATYLAAGFYRRFQARIGREKVSITKDVVDNWMDRLGLTVKQVHNEVVKGCESLVLPDVDYKALLQLGTLLRGCAPQCWAMPADAWCDKCSGKREQNRAALSAGLSVFDFHACSADSLVGRVFRTLCELSMDPEYGPYYAAGLLHHVGYDMISALNSAIKQAEEELEIQEFHLNSENGPIDYAVQCNENFVRHTLFSRHRNYQLYKESIINLYVLANRMRELSDTIATLCSLRSRLENLYNAYFVPLLQLLDDLKETFEENIHYLSSPAAAPAACTRHILALQDIMPPLDKAVDDLDENTVVSRFMTHILNGFDQWQSGDDGKISQYISLYMEQVFDAEFNRSLQDYLFNVYPAAGGNPTLLAQTVERDIIHHLHHAAFPVFLCEPTFNLSDSGAVYQQGEILEPYNVPALQSAAYVFHCAHPEYVVYQTSCSNRISIVRHFSGVPLYACGYLPMWKHAYDNMEGRARGGIHLYAKTERSRGDSRDWYTFLPDLVPASCMPDISPSQEEILDLYRRGEEAGIIGTNAWGSFVLYQTPVLVLPDYGPEDFWKDHIFQTVSFEAAQTDLRQRLENFCNHISVQTEHPLKDDGNRLLGDETVAQVRRDYFLRAPVLQQILREELDKLHSLQGAIQRLDHIQADLTCPG